MAEPIAVLDRTNTDLNRSGSDLDRLTADLFDLDVRTLQVPMACTNHTNDGCSASCPSRGCSKTCSCSNCNCKK